MKLVIQRVVRGSVKVNDVVVGQIRTGLFVLVGIRDGDTEDNAALLAEKLSKLRVMSDDNKKMNLSVRDAGGSVLVISQFTLYADTTAGNRPSFIKAGDPYKAENIYNYFIEYLRDKGINVATGIFGAYMEINVKLDGPVTIIVEK